MWLFFFSCFFIPCFIIILISISLPFCKALCITTVCEMCYIKFALPCLALPYQASQILTCEFLLNMHYITGRWHELYLWWWWSTLGASENHDAPTLKKSAPRSHRSTMRSAPLILWFWVTVAVMTFKIIWLRAWARYYCWGPVLAHGHLLPTAILWRCWFHFPAGLGTCPHCQRYQKLVQWSWCNCA